MFLWKKMDEMCTWSDHFKWVSIRIGVNSLGFDMVIFKVSGSCLYLLLKHYNFWMMEVQLKELIWLSLFVSDLSLSSDNYSTTNF